MEEVVEAYMELLISWTDHAERDALEITDQAEFEDMQDRIIMLKFHLATTKSVLNAVREAMQ